jgi:hypothetical protein
VIAPEGSGADNGDSQRLLDFVPTLACEATNLSRSSAISSVRRAALIAEASIL